MTTFFFGRSPLSVSCDSISFTTSMPSRTWPNTTCLPSNQGVCIQGTSHTGSGLALALVHEQIDKVTEAAKRVTSLVCTRFTLTVQMKNWLPLVFGPALAILTAPGPVWTTKTRKHHAISFSRRLETTCHFKAISDEGHTFEVLIFESSSIYAFPASTLQM